MPGDRVELDPHWPGLELEPEETRVEPETLDTTAGLLRAEHYAHMDGMSTGTLSFLSAADPPEGSFWFGEWPTGEYMERGMESARTAILEYYRLVDQQIEAAAELFAKTAEDYRELDDDIASNMDKVEGWDRLAAPVEMAPAAPAAPPAGVPFEEVMPVEGQIMPEDTSGYNADWIKGEIDRLKANETWKSLGWRADTYEQVAEHLDGVADRLKGQARTLAEEWNSETSVAAQQALQRIAGTARHLAEQSRKVRDFANRSAEVLQTKVHEFPDDTGVPWWEDLDDALGGSHQEGKHNEFRQKLAELNEAYGHVNELELPKQVSANLPQLTDIPPRRDKDDRWGPDGGTGTGPGSSFVPSGPPQASTPEAFEPTGTVPGDIPGSATGTAQVPGTGELSGPGSGFAGGGVPDEIDGPVDDDWSSGGLAGAGPGPVGGPAGGVPGGPSGVPGGPSGPGLGPAGTGAPGTPAGPAGPGGFGMVPGGTGRGGGAGSVPGGGGGRGGGSGVGGLGRGGAGMVPIGGAGAGGAGSGGGRTGGKPGGVSGASGGPAGRGVAGGMAPMAGAGRGGDKQHSQPDSWLVEDDDPWRPDDDVPPGIIR